MILHRKITSYRLLWVLIAIFISDKTFGQDENFDELTSGERMFFGINMGWVSKTETFFEVVPVAGYRINQKWMAGLGLKYEYYENTGAFFGNTDYGYSTSIYGGTLFSNYEFLKDVPSKGLSFFVDMEMESLLLPNKYFKEPGGTGRFVHSSFLTGGGIRQRIGNRVSLNILILLAFNTPNPSPYPNNPFLRFSVLF